MPNNYTVKYQTFTAQESKLLPNSSSGVFSALCRQTHLHDGTTECEWVLKLDQGNVVVEG